MKLWIIALASLLWAATAVAAPPAAVDLPACGELPSAAGQESRIRLGLVAPAASPAMASHLATLGQLSERLTSCSESWSAVLPVFTPWAKVPELERYHGWAAFIAALIVTLGLLAALTPSRWWKHPTVLGLLAIAAGTWGGGVLLLVLANAAGLPQTLLYGHVVSLQRGYGAVEWADVADIRALDRALLAAGISPEPPAAALRAQAASAQPLALLDAPGGKPVAAPPNPLLVTTGRSNTTQAGEIYVELALAGAAPASPPTPTYWAVLSALRLGPPGNFAPGQLYRVRQHLSVREAPGVDGKRIAIFLAGSTVTALGDKDGDWWKIRQGTTEGWVSSLWLRRVDEK